jgi:hypothetical protein
MESQRTGIKRFVGWPVSILLFISYNVSEWGSRRIGGNLGSFLWVTGHFVLFPILSIVLIGTIIFLMIREKDWPKRFILIGFAVVPGVILYVTYRVDLITAMMRLYGPIRR